MDFNETTRKLSADYIKRKDGTLYTDHPIYLGIHDLPENYEEGNQADYEAWVEEQSNPSEE